MKSVSASPQSEHSIWAASSSNSGLASLAVRLRTLSGSAEYSQDGMHYIWALRVLGFASELACVDCLTCLFQDMKGEHAIR